MRTITADLSLPCHFISIITACAGAIFRAMSPVHFHTCRLYVALDSLVI